MRDGSGTAAAFTMQMPSVAHALASPVDEAMPSFDDVYGAHAAFVWRTLRVFGVPDAHIEDAVQDVFIVVHRRLPEWQARAAITTWLFAIARRVASTHRRKGARAEEGGAALDEFEGTSDTFAALSRVEAAATVMAILDRLGEDQRTVFALVELEQLTVPEVAKLLDINLNTAYSRLRLARTAFEAAVKKVRP